MKKIPSKIGYFSKYEQFFLMQIQLEILAMQTSLYISRVVLVCRARAEVDLNKSTTEASSSYLSPLHFPSLLLESEY
jgi:hypothetical protein